MRDINAGEEITYDYSSTVGPNILSRIWKMPCSCGHENCRGKIGSILAIPKSVLGMYIAEGALPDYIQRYLTADCKTFFSKGIAKKSVGISFWVLTGYAFSYILYPFVIYRAGAFRGGAVMALLSFIVCLCLLKLYDASKRDWLGIETIKGVKE